MDLMEELGKSWSAMPICQQGINNANLPGSYCTDSKQAVPASGWWLDACQEWMN